MSSREIIAWAVPTFQMMIWLSQPDKAKVTWSQKACGRGQDGVNSAQKDTTVDTCTEKDVVCRRVPGNNAHALGVAVQYHYRLRHVGDKTIVRNLPNLPPTGM